MAFLHAVDNVLQGLSYYYIPTVQRLAILMLTKTSLLMYLKALHIKRIIFLIRVQRSIIYILQSGSEKLVFMPENIDPRSDLELSFS